MTRPADRSALLATALRSPDATAAHDRTAWLNLFTDDGTVIDPVGSRPHRGRDALGKFYDTFIAPREIAFSSDADVVSGQSVYRDVTLAVRLATSVTIDVPAILRYDIAVDQDALRVSQLRAYWELSPMIGALVRNGLAAVPVAVALSAAMLRNQGVAGTGGFLTAFRRPGHHAVDTLRELIEGASTSEHQIAGRTVESSVPTTVNGRLLDSATELVAALDNARGRKYIAAGTTVAAVLDHDQWTGFIFAEFNRSTPTSLAVVTEPRRTPTS
ncbi:nuclear transport factor 2 family protein [Gordonia sp. CPCC 205333]|uniref:nuclear transport factor 2 family protein n=1 Tax=Gordonia sp. CPCC 205333 TaxID=3140790 RepID=UPI003AF3FC50